MSDAAPSRPRCRAGPALVAALLAAGCAGIFRTGGGELRLEDRFRRAESALQEGRHERAALDLRFLAGRCESDARGREAVLMLAALELDVRNPEASPRAAARLAARYLQMPAAPASSLALAETLYLLALDLGSPPVEDPFGAIPTRAGDAVEADRGRVEQRSSGYWTVADRFEDCDSPPREEAEPKPLPEHPGPTVREILETLAGRADSLSARVDSLSGRIRSLMTDAARAERLQARTDSLEAELERIRSLLQSGLGPSEDRPDGLRPPDIMRAPGDNPGGRRPPGRELELP